MDVDFLEELRDRMADGSPSMPTHTPDQYVGALNATKSVREIALLLGDNLGLPFVFVTTETMRRCLDLAYLHAGVSKEDRVYGHTLGKLLYNGLKNYYSHSENDSEKEAAASLEKVIDFYETFGDLVRAEEVDILGPSGKEHWEALLTRTVDDITGPPPPPPTEEQKIASTLKPYLIWIIVILAIILMVLIAKRYSS